MELFLAWDGVALFMLSFLGGIALCIWAYNNGNRWNQCDDEEYP